MEPEVALELDLEVPNSTVLQVLALKNPKLPITVSPVLYDEPSLTVAAWSI